MKHTSAAIGDISRFVGGGTPNKSNQDFYTGNIPWVSPKDMKVWRIDCSEDMITEAAVKGSAAKMLPTNTVLVVVRSGILKHTLPVAISACPLAINQDLKGIIPSERVDPTYLARMIKAAEPIVLGWVRATTADNFPIEKLKELHIPLPPLPEQRRIAAILDQADALRRLRRQSLSRLSELGQAIFFEMFGDATSNPRGWPTMRLGDLCGVGSSKRVFVSEFADSGVPFYRGTEVGQLGAGNPIDPNLFISPQHYERLIAESGRPEIGDLLLPSICHDGRIWMVNDGRPFYFKDGRVLWIKSANADIDGEYLRRHLQGMLLRDYSKIASGTTFAELKIVNLKSLQILYPPLDLQRQFAERISSLERTRGNSLGAIDMIETLFTSLQHRAFRGDL